MSSVGTAISVAVASAPSPCVVNPCSVPSSGRRPAVLAEDPTKPIAALDPPGRQWDHVGRLTGRRCSIPWCGRA